MGAIFFNFIVHVLKILIHQIDLFYQADILLSDVEAIRNFDKRMAILVPKLRLKHSQPLAEVIEPLILRTRVRGRVEKAYLALVDSHFHGSLLYLVLSIFLSVDPLFI